VKWWGLVPSPPLSSLSPPPSPLPFPSVLLPLEVGPLNAAKGVWGSAVSSPSAEIEFGTF